MSETFPCNTALRLPGPAGVIEALAECALAARAVPAAAVICHPHSLHGGSLHNKVVHMLARALRELGCDTLRFNFRGVGQSEGRFDHGRGETEDLRAVVRWLQQRRPQAELWLAGFSFGAYVALRAAADLAPARLITVAPPVNLYPELQQLPRPPACPWLIVQGEQDEIVPAPAVARWAQTLHPPPDIAWIPQAGHFFHRRLGELRAAVQRWAGPPV